PAAPAAAPPVAAPPPTTAEAPAAPPQPVPEPAPAPEPAPVAAAESTSAASNGGGVVTSPLVRRMIAEQGLDPSQIQGTGERSRRAHQAEWKREEGFSLTYLPFIVRAFCDVVHDYPHVNASVEGESLVVHRNLHLGIAVDLDFKGLVAPVIRNADGKRLRLVA